MENKMNKGTVLTTSSIYFAFMGVCGTTIARNISSTSGGLELLLKGIVCGLLIQAVVVNLCLCLGMFFSRQKSTALHNRIISAMKIQLTSIVISAAFVIVLKIILML